MADAMKLLLEEARDLLLERRQGSPARSAAHNARLVIEDAIKLAASPPAREEALGEWADGYDPSLSDEENILRFERHISALRARTSEPAREPVAWRYRTAPHRQWHLTTSAMDAGYEQADGSEVQPLYTHPGPAAADKLKVAVEAIREKIGAPLAGPTHGAWDRGRTAGLKEALATLNEEG